MSQIKSPLLALCVSLGPIVCLAAEPIADQAKAIAEIRKLHGRVTIDEKSPDKPVIEASLSGPQASDAALEHLKGLTQLRTLNLGGAQVTDAGLANLKNLFDLQDLDLRETRVTGTGLANLEGLSHLRSIDLAGVEVTDAGLVGLKALNHLRSLNLAGTPVADAGLTNLTRLTDSPMPRPFGDEGHRQWDCKPERLDET